MTAILVVAALRWLWVFTILIGTSYVVFWLGYSGWWWLLAILLMSTAISSDDKDDKKND